MLPLNDQNKKLITQYKRPQMPLIATARFTRTPCMKCRRNNQAHKCRMRPSPTKKFWKVAQDLEVNYAGYIPALNCPNNSNSIDFFAHFDQNDIYEGDKLEVNFYYIRVGCKPVVAGLSQFLNDKSLDDPSIGPLQWHDICVHHQAQKVKRELQSPENRGKYTYTDAQLKEYANEVHVMSEHYFCIMYNFVDNYSWRQRVKEWRYCIKRMGGDNILIDWTFSTVKHIHAAFDGDVTIEDMELLQDFDKRKLQYKVQVSVLNGQNKYHFCAFSAFTPNQSEASVYCIPFMAEYFAGCCLFSEKPIKGLHIQTDGLSGNKNLAIKTAYAIKQLYGEKINGISIDEMSRNFDVCTYILYIHRTTHHFF